MAKLAGLVHYRGMRQHFASLTVVAACGIAGAIVSACSGAACEKDVVAAAPSPDGAVIAFVYRRTCGPATDVSTHVAVVKFDESLHDAPGNVLAVPGAQPVKILWEGPKMLRVSGFEHPTFQRTAPIASVALQFTKSATPEAR